MFVLSHLSISLPFFLSFLLSFFPSFPFASSQDVNKLIVLAIRQISKSIESDAAVGAPLDAAAHILGVRVDVLVGVGHARVLDLGGLAVLHAAALLAPVEEDEVQRLQHRGGGRGDEEAEDGAQAREVGRRVAGVEDDGADYVAR